MEEEKNIRTRNWAFIIYPESMPDDYISILQENFIPFAISPLHDRDVNADGTPKKPHYHVLLTADGVKSYDQIKAISNSVNGVEPKPINSVKGYYRYLCHLDNPEKAQYKEEDISVYFGFNQELYSKPDSTVRYKHIQDMIHYITKNNITEYYEFLLYCSNERFDDWFKLLCDNCSYVINDYIKSFRNFLKGS